MPARTLFGRIRTPRLTLLQIGRRLDRVRDAVDGLDELRVLVSRVRGDRLLRQRLEDWAMSSGPRPSMNGGRISVEDVQSLTWALKPSISWTDLSVPSGHSARGPVPPVPGGYASRRLGRGLLRYLTILRGGCGMSSIECGVEKVGRMADGTFICRSCGGGPGEMTSRGVGGWSSEHRCPPVGDRRPK